MEEKKESPNWIKSRSAIITIVYVLLLVFSGPWYWNVLGLDPVRPLIFGLPRWFVVVIGHSFLVSVFTAWCVLTFRLENNGCNAIDSQDSANGERS